MYTALYGKGHFCRRVVKVVNKEAARVYTELAMAVTDLKGLKELEVLNDSFRG